jgi:hypothetical protein
VSSVGEVVRLGAHVTDEAGADLNAVDTTLTVTLPDDSTQTLDVLNPPARTGYYQVDYVPTLPGGHTWLWAFQQPAVVLEGSFYVSQPGMVGLLSLAEAKKILRITDSRSDDEVAATVVRATELAETQIHELLVRRPVVETRDLGYSWRTGIALTYRPVTRVTLVERLNGDGSVIEVIAPPAAWADEHGILRCARPVFFTGLVRISYVAGPAVVSEMKRGAVEYLVQHLWTNRGATLRPRVGGGEDSSSTQDGLSRSALPLRVIEQLGPRGPLVG